MFGDIMRIGQSRCKGSLLLKNNCAGTQASSLRKGQGEIGHHLGKIVSFHSWQEEPDEVAKMY